MTDFLTLKNVHDQQGHLVGEKVIKLAKLYPYFSIPQGFIITKSVFEEFLRETGLLAHFKQLSDDLQSEDEEKFQAAANKIQKEIVSTMIPREMLSNIKERYHALTPTREKSLKAAMNRENDPFVAVRSCAVHYNDTKKLHLSFTNIQGEERLKKAILTVWASFFTGAAIKYRRQQNVQEGSLAIFIQQMLTPTQSGIVCSTDPEQHNQMLVKACRGIGTAICHNEVIPDVYRVDKQLLTVTSKDIQKQAILYHRDLETNKTMKIELEDDLGSEQKLTEEQIREVALLARRVETQIEQPQAIEFAFDKGVLYILQSNDIPCLEKVPELEEQPALTIAVIPEEIPDHPTQHQEFSREEAKEEEEELFTTDEDEHSFVFNAEEDSTITVKEGKTTQEEEKIEEELPFAAITTTVLSEQQGEAVEQQPEEGEKTSRFSMILKPTESLRKSINSVLSNANISLRHDNQPISIRFETAETNAEQKDKKREPKEKVRDPSDEWSVENTTYLDDERNKETKEESSDDLLSFNSEKESSTKETEKEVINEESSTDDGIFFALPEESIVEKKGEPTLTLDDDIVREESTINYEKKHHMLYEHTRHAASKLVVSCYMTINAALKQRFKELKGVESDLTFNELAEELKEKIPHYEEILKINELRHAFIEDFQHPSSTEVKQALDVCEKFVKEF